MSWVVKSSPRQAAMQTFNQAKGAWLEEAKELGGVFCLLSAADLQTMVDALDAWRERD